MASSRSKGVYAALLSAFFMGMTPVFGKQAILAGLPPLAVVTLRTLFSAFLLLAVVALFKRRYLYIYPAGLVGCLFAGWTNGIGSLFYYSALGRIDAGIGHLLYSLYPLFLVFWLALDRQRPGRLTVVRLGLALPGVILLSRAAHGALDLTGVVQMLIAAALYALHIPINQRVLYDMPAPTVTLYTLLAMSMVVVPVFWFSNLPAWGMTSGAWTPIIALTVVTFLSRLTLFVGVKHLGGMETALLGLSELLVAVSMATLWLGERLSPAQWLGAALLVVSLAMVLIDKSPPKKHTIGGWLGWLAPNLSTDLADRHR